MRAIGDDSTSRLATAAGLALGFAADRVWGDPRRGHPVAGFGRVADWFERRTYADRRLAGTGHVVILVGAASALGLVMERMAGSRAVLRTTLIAATTWSVLGGRSLSREADAVAAQLARNDLAAARVQVRNLVGRETAELGSDEIARACVESVAENTSDAVAAPLLWGAVAGIPGLLGYRAANTLDAMVGHRTARYRRFGWAAARLDDLLNWLPARITGLIAAVVAPLVGGTSPAAFRAMVAGRRAASEPQRRSGGGGVRRSAGRTARGPQRLRGDGGGPRAAGRRSPGAGR